MHPGGELKDQCRSMQLDELELVAATFPEAELHGDGTGFGATLQLEGYGQLQLGVEFPWDYPLHALPVCAVRPSRQLSGSSLAAVQGVVDAAVVATHREAGGSDCSALQLLLTVPELLSQALGASQTGTNIPEPEPELEPEQDDTGGESGTALRVLLVRMDHVKAVHARKVIAALAAQMSLGRILRPGKPGLICVEGSPPAVEAFETELRRQLGTCTRTMGCWGPANHHFQSISVVGQVDQPPPQPLPRRGGAERESINSARRFSGFLDVETETLMHAAHLFIDHGLSSLFYEGTGLDPEWCVPTDTGGADPYLKPRGGTKMKKSNKRVH